MKLQNPILNKLHYHVNLLLCSPSWTQSIGAVIGVTLGSRILELPTCIPSTRSSSSGPTGVHVNRIYLKEA